MNVRELRSQAKARKIPKYYRMGKAQLLSALGMSAEAKAHKSQATRRKAIAFNATKEGGDSSVKKALVKGRIVRSIKRGLVAEEKKQGRALTQQEKRTVATRALASEAKAIRSGTPEMKPKRGNGQAKGGRSHKDSQPSKNSIESANLEDKISANRKRAAKLQGELQEIARDRKPMSMRHYHQDLIKDLDREHKSLTDQLSHLKPKEQTPTAKRGIAAFKRKPKAEPVEQKIKLEDVKTPSDRAKYAKQEAAHQRSQGNEKAAKAWDDKAKEGRQAAISRDTIAKTQSQTNLFGVTDHASDMPLFGGHQEEPAKKPVSEAKEPRGLQEISPHDLHFDPKRFQYKLVHGETGASGSLTGVGKWDENLGGVMLGWHDPKDGKNYVINGHNRNTLARKLGAEKVAVRFINAASAHEARALGAMANVAEGSGTAIDAAKFFRDSNATREDLEAKGISMKQKIAVDGLALSRLAPHLFDKVVQGDIPIERATLIGDRIRSHEDQTKLVELIDKAQSKGRKITNDVVRELADTVQSAPSHTETQFDLFGASETTQNLALEKAELTAHVRSRLSREKKLFGLVSKSKAAKELERGGNSIDTEKSKDISDQASQVLGVFDKLKNQSGPVSSAINKAVERIANGEDSKKVRDDLHSQLLEDIPQALGIKTERSGEVQKELRIKRSPPSDKQSSDESIGGNQKEKYSTDIKDVAAIRIPVGEFILPRQNVASNRKERKSLGRAMVDARIGNDNFEILIKENKAGTQATHVVKDKSNYTITRYLPGMKAQRSQIPISKFGWAEERELGF